MAYALAGRMDVDLTREPLQGDVRLADIWPSQREVADAIEQAVESDMFRRSYGEVFAGDENWNGLEVPAGDRYAWDPESTYVKRPPYFDGMDAEPAAGFGRITGARAIALLGDSVTTDHISPAGAIARDSPAGRYLPEHGVERRDFNSYGSRRGNHEVMMRGTFANVRLRNQLAPGTEGGVTVWDGEQTTIYEAAMTAARAGHPAVRAGRRGVRVGLVARLGGQGPEPARHPLRPRAVLRAHPPLQPRRHGRAAAAVPRRRVGRLARPHRRRRRSTSRRSRTGATTLTVTHLDRRRVRRARAHRHARTSGATSATAGSCTTCCASCWAGGD